MSKLRLPATLAVAVLSASACGDDPSSAADASVALADARPSPDAASAADAGVAADASGDFDAGCQVFEAYDPSSGRCIPVA